MNNLPATRTSRLNTLVTWSAASLLGASAWLSSSLAETQPTANEVQAETKALPQAMIDGTGPGWRALGKDDFQNVNCNEDTWTWEDNGVKCNGNPVGVIRSVKPYTNLEMVCEWRHMKDAGNSGIFIWSPLETLDRLKAPGLPEGIEVQVLDLGYKTAYEKGGRKANWFTCHGDVFPVGKSTMEPFPPMAPNKRRSFPTEDRTLDTGEWNHYYIRAVNGEVRLWVNGKEVSGGANCNPRTGYLCLESEGSPIEFRNLRIRELP